MRAIGAAIALFCALLAAPALAATPAPVWMVPQVTPLGQSTGYTQYCDTNEDVTLCGTYPARYVFTCHNPMNMWLSRDDDNSGWVVHFPTPTEIAGFKFKVWAAITDPAPTRTYTQTFTFRQTTDTRWGNDYEPSVQPFFTAVASNIHDRVWTQYQWLLPTPVTISNLRMDFQGDTWATTQPVSILTQPTTARAC